MTTWIVCAEEGRARLFQCQSLDDGVSFMQDYPDPNTEQRFAGEFIDSICQFLERSRKDARFDHLVLCADHPLLVVLRGNLTEETRNLVIGAVEQDLYGVNESDLVNYVTTFIIDAHKSAA